MAIATRTQVMNAILTLIQGMTFASPINGATTWKIAPSTRLRLWGDVDATQQPCAFLVTHRETNEYRGLGLLRRRLDLAIYCYCRTDSEVGQGDLDTMMEAFEGAFNIVDRDSSGSNTLGGLVSFCRIEGRVIKDPGDIDNQALLIVPLVVEMP